MSQPLDQGAHYTVVATATSTAGSTSTSTSTFVTLTARSRLLTGMTPLDGAVGRCRRDHRSALQHRHPRGVRAALLERIQVTSTPAVLGGWHWLTANVVHFRPATFWPAGTKVTVTANLKGFDAGNGIWGLGDWTSSFSVGAKHLSIINNSTHTMQVFNNDKLIAT